MENTNQPNAKDALNAADLALSERIGVLERQMEEQRTQAAEAPRSPFLEKGELSAELERHRDQLRNYEKALVERIADVDDDRRATASRLQRAWQTQREEIDERLRRHVGIVASAVLLFALAFAVGLYLVYRQATTPQPQPELTEEIAEVRNEIGRIAGESLPAEQVRGELARLSKGLEQLSSSLPKSDKDAGETDGADIAAERSAREKGDARIAEEIRRLNAERTSLVEELAALRAAMEAAEATRASEAASAEAASAQSLADARTAAAPSAESPSSDSVADVGPEGLDGVAPPGAPDATDEAQPPVVDSSAAADEDADALGSEESVVAGEESYALQLIGFFSRNSLAAFAAREGLPEKVFYIRQTYRGRPWFALVHSLHQDYASAVDALSALPEDLVTLNPWIRPVTVGTELRALESGPQQGGDGE